MTATENHKAPDRTRRTALWLVVAALILAGVIVTAFGDPRYGIEAWIARQLEAPDGIQAILLTISTVAILPIVAIGVYLFTVGSRTVRSQRYPPPRFALLRDVRVLEGRPAVRRGRLLQTLSGLVTLAALLLPLMIWWAARSLSGLG